MRSISARDCLTGCRCSRISRPIGIENLPDVELGDASERHFEGIQEGPIGPERVTRTVRAGRHGDGVHESSLRVEERDIEPEHHPLVGERGVYRLWKHEQDPSSGSNALHLGQPAGPECWPVGDSNLQLRSRDRNHSRLERSQLWCNASTRVGHGLLEEPPVLSGESPAFLEGTGI
jgi:hypothetical protein